MRIALLVGLVIATAACGGYRFPGPQNETGTVHGRVIAFGCGGLGQSPDRPCPATPAACPPQAVGPNCGQRPLSGFELDFVNGGTNRITKTDAAGAYSIDLPVGTWRASAGNYGRIVDGPQTIVVSVGASLEADYVVDTGIRAAA